VGGPDGKIFGSRSGRKELAALGPCVLTESQIFSHPARPHSAFYPYDQDVTKTGNGEWGMGNGEWGMGNGEWDDSGEWEIKMGI